MNILIPYSWLKEYLDVNLSPKEFANVVSLHGPSIERWHETADGDVVFDVEITTNRIDAYSVYGLAREAHAILQYNDIEATLREPDLPEIINGSGVNHQLYVDVDEELCPRFTAVVIESVEVGESPKFMQKRLEKIGVRSLNNVVDITNYVMWEVGQPMHVFDYDKIKNHKMTLRKSKPGEKLETLDGTTRKIPEGSIVIEDGERLIDLAGIMGGENSAVDENTRRVLLFVQTYNPHVIRKTSMAMAHRTEAAARFEKGLDPENVTVALQRAADLFLEHTGGVIASDVIDIYPNPYMGKTASIELEKVNTLVGVAVPPEDIKRMLSLLGFEVSVGHEIVTVQIPSWRADDITIDEDLVEEIARMYGYHKIPSQLPTGQIPQRPDNIASKRVKQAKIALKYLGFTELFTNSAVGKDQIAKLQLDPNDYITIKNPLTEDFVVMRPHLLASMLPVVAENLPRFPDMRIFELSKVYIPEKKGLPLERRMLQFITTDTDLLRLKGVIETLADEIGVHTITTKPDGDSSPRYLPGTAAHFVHEKEEIGHIGILSTEIGHAFGINQPLAIAKLNFDYLIEHSSDDLHFKPIPKYPALLEDVSVAVSIDQPVGLLIDQIKNLDKLITNVALIDTYIGDRVGEGKKSLTFRITYQSPTKLLSDKEVGPLSQKIKSIPEVQS